MCCYFEIINILGPDLLCRCKRVVLGHPPVTPVLVSGVLDYMYLQLPVLPSLPCKASHYCRHWRGCS